LFHPWRLAIGIMAAINLAAFWFLLQYNYSPESYHTVPSVSAERSLPGSDQHLHSDCYRRFVM